ncbi:MAG: hypothetical protein N2C13_05760 [Chloroflexota bacterium]
MTVIPISLRTRIESNFWSTLVVLMDNSELARQLTPKVMMGWRRARNYMWIPKSIGLASGGLLFGFVAGMLVKFYLSY